MTKDDVNSPTDAELWQLHMQMPGVHKNPIDFARAVLAKWGSPQSVVREPLTCEWMHNDDDSSWDTSCGKAWRFDDGGPAENSMHFCHSCGKSLRIKGGQHGTE